VESRANVRSVLVRDLSAVCLGVGMKRYDLQWTTRCGVTFEELTESDDGEWLRFEDHAAEVHKLNNEITRLQLEARLRSPEVPPIPGPTPLTDAFLECHPHPPMPGVAVDGCNCGSCEFLRSPPPHSDGFTEPDDLDTPVSVHGGAGAAIGWCGDMSGSPYGPSDPPDSEPDWDAICRDAELYRQLPKCAIDKTCLEYPRCRCGGDTRERAPPK
jgi:hypothetical protein